MVKMDKWWREIKMKLTFLGSGDAFSSGGRLHTCMMVESKSKTFLIDCGASALIGMKKYNVNPNEIDFIFISHLHGDHFGGIPFFIIDAQLIQKRTKPLTIAGPPGTKERVIEAMEVFFRGSSKVKQKFELTIIEFDLTKENTFGDIVVKAFEVVHPSGSPSLALRIEHEGKTITYTGDTEWTETLIPASKNADLLIAECYFFEKNVKFHLNYQTLLKYLPEMSPKKVILTHLGEDMLKRIDEMDEMIAEDGKVIFI